MPSHRHLIRKCCICGKKPLTHPGLKMHMFPRDVRRYVHVFFPNIFSLVTENTVYTDAIVEVTHPVGFYSIRNCSHAYRVVLIYYSEKLWETKCYSCLLFGVDIE